MFRLIFVVICLCSVAAGCGGCHYEGIEPAENPSVTNLGYGHVLVCNNNKCQLFITPPAPSREWVESQLESLCRAPAYREKCEALYNERAARLAEEQALQAPVEDPDQGILYKD
jgi:hypothetical protein